MTLTLDRIEINEFWDKILKALILGVLNLVPELIYLASNSRYGVGHVWTLKCTVLDIWKFEILAFLHTTLCAMTVFYFSNTNSASTFQH